MIETSTIKALAVRRATGLSPCRAEPAERTGSQLAVRAEHVRCRVRRVRQDGHAAAAIGRYLANAPVAAVVDRLCRVTVAV